MHDVSSNVMVDGAAGDPWLELALYPNPPLGRYGIVVVMLAATTVGGILGAAFATLGAWPVSGFLGLDIVLLGAALQHARKRAQRVEVIRLDATGLRLRRIGPAGAAIEDVRFEPYWVHVVVDERRHHDPRLSFRSHGRSVPFGTFLAAEERRELAMELRAALADWRAAQSRSPSTSTMS